MRFIVSCQKIRVLVFIPRDTVTGIAFFLLLSHSTYIHIDVKLSPIQ